VQFREIIGNFVVSVEPSGPASRTTTKLQLLSRDRIAR
jgi:hypothetical protein